MRFILTIPCVLVFAFAAFAEAPEDRFADSSREIVYLSQNWTPNESLEFYALRQGSPLLRKVLFDALEQPGSTDLFTESEYLGSFGFLRQRRHSLNPDGYPIGFVGELSVELNCSACHTSKVTHGEIEYRIDGGQAIIDLESWMEALVDSMKLTLQDAPTLGSLRQQVPTSQIALDLGTKFGRFAKRLTGNDRPRTSQVYAIVSLLKSDYERRQKYNDLNDFGKAFHGDDTSRQAAIKHAPYGFTRLDALGAILNQATSIALNVDENAHKADAPVNFPAIWDAPQHSHVQWNGAVDNRGHLGPLGRNAGQVIGVFGLVDIDGDAFIGYDSSVRFGDLKRAEELVTTLWSPQWPFAIDSSKVDQGRDLFVQNCRACHADMKRDDPDRDPKDLRIPIEEEWEGHAALATDPLAATRFMTRDAVVGPLKGRYKKLPLGERFANEPSENVRAREILSHMVLRVVARSFVPWRDELTLGADGPEGMFVESAGAVEKEQLMVYKCRPLNGIWSTAPYLHNGSVLNMRELLTPSSQRLAEFRVGTTEYDPPSMGFKNEGNSLIITSLPGNSRDGHEYGTQLTGDQKDALIEYLKTL